MTYGPVDEPTAPLYPVRRHQPPPHPWWRNSSVWAVTGSFLALVVLATAVFVALRPDPAPAGLPGPIDTSPPSGAPSPTATPSPSGSPSPTPPPSRRPTATVPVPTKKPPKQELPPPPPPPSPEPGCTDHEEWHKDQDAPPAVVRSALAEAGARLNWREGVPVPAGWPSGEPYPDITIPARLMNAVAWTESDWRSTVIACDGGIGLMQVMPDTAPWMNQRFHRSFDVSTVEGNAAIGAMYLQWLTMYFGLYYYGTFDHDAVAPVGDGGAEIRLGDVVIAAYNVGYGAVEDLHGTPTDGTDDTLHIPNQWYVDRVRGYEAACPCDNL